MEHINRMPTKEDFNRLVDEVRESRVVQVPAGLDLRGGPGGTAILGRLDEGATTQWVTIVHDPDDKTVDADTYDRAGVDTGYGCVRKALTVVAYNAYKLYQKYRQLTYDASGRLTEVSGETQDEIVDLSTGLPYAAAEAATSAWTTLTHDPDDKTVDADTYTPGTDGVIFKVLTAVVYNTTDKKFYQKYRQITANRYGRITAISGETQDEIIDLVTCA